MRPRLDRRLERLLSSRPRRRARPVRSPAPVEEPRGAAWRGQTLEECAVSLAEALGLRVVECAILDNGSWDIRLDDNTETTTLYRMMLADNKAKVKAFLASKVVPPPWGLTVVFTFYFGDSTPRSSFEMKWPKENGI